MYPGATQIPFLSSPVVVSKMFKPMVIVSAAKIVKEQVIKRGKFK